MPGAHPSAESLESSRLRSAAARKCTQGGLNLQTGVRQRRGERLLSFVAAGATWLLLACAAQGPLRPPRVERPERVKDLAVAQVGQRLEISFTLPAQATDGERLSKPVEIQIFRAATPSSQKPPKTPPTLNPWTALLPDDLTRYTRGEKTEYTDRLSDQEFSQSLDTIFTFAIRAFTRGFRGRPVESELSNIAPVAVLDVSGPPANLQPHTTENAIELSWSIPSLSLTGRPVTTLAGYRVYRSAMENPGSFRTLGEIQSPPFRDLSFRFGHKYTYKVRAVFKEGDWTADSEDSLPVPVTPLDIFPPAPPRGLSAVYTAQAVEVIWTANTEPDLAGYNLYRQEDSGTPHRINKELLPTPIYHDTSVEPGRKYSYRATAVDLANNESQPSEETITETR